MTNENLIQLAFTIHNNEGAYALLLGSGISRSASIPTGYEVTIEMIRQLSSLHKDQPEDLEKWYLEKFGKHAEYSDLLDMLGKTPTERHGFLRQFFEPTEQELDEGKKQPTAAHRVIAKMVASGKVRVIITTNFDRLIEQAIQEEGVTPTIISSADATEGAMPLIHSKCTVIKVNGDYLDTRAKNTIDELQQYDVRQEKLLERIFDEFGLLICGWSGDWDHGLRSCLERTKSRRFSCYWCIKGKPSDTASSLMNLRLANRIEIESADKFFLELEDKLQSLAEVNKPHPLSGPLAVASLKRYMVESKYHIQLHDLLMSETNRVCTRLTSSDYSISGNPVPDGSTMQARIEKYNNDLTTLLPLFMNLCFWAKPEHGDLCLKVLHRIANSVPEGGGYQVWNSLRLFPASLVLCTGGMAAILAGNYSLFFKLLTFVKVKQMHKEVLSVERLLPYSVLKQDIAQTLPSQIRKYTPMNNIVFDFLNPLFLQMVYQDDEYKLLFDRFEYLSAMVYVDIVPNSNRGHYAWAPPGQFAWREDDGYSISKIIEEELLTQANDWPLLKTGAFSKKLDQAKSCKRLLDGLVPELKWNW